ncbi:gluconokinase [Ahrensia sp. R2A130]|uniref:gluconokinase n=1 Tax=Ahrensia sp. R2A130 TaxID=744979 RepID=UPI0002F1852E
MGVAGCGKSTIGEGLAGELGGIYVEGDELHPQANIDKMSAGEPLNDDDRMPWLTKIAQALVEHSKRQDGPVFVGCSALKRIYRDHIRNEAEAPVTFVYLDGSRELIEGRMSARKGHFMPTSLLDSQFADLQPPQHDERFIRVDISAEPTKIIAQATASLAELNPQTA